MASSARKAAHTALVKMQRSGGYSNLVLDAQLNSIALDKKDISLASAIFYGVIERMYTLDFIIRRYAGKRADKLPFSVINALRVGTYQILYMDKIPAHAAVSETVELVKKSDKWAVGFINAVLKKILSEREACIEAIAKSDNPEIKYSCKRWIYDTLRQDYGAAADDILHVSFDSTPVTLRVNTLKNSRTQLEELLKSAGIEAHAPYDQLDALMLEKGSGIEHMKLYKDGRFHVQDIASQLCCMALSVESGMRVLDVCAAPGGKSFTIAEMMKDSGEIISQDVHEARVKLIQRGADRLGIKSIKAVQGDASECSEDLGLFDRVLCDVPCSGLGVMSKKPDIKYKDYEDVKDLPRLQLKILMSAQKRLKPGGVLVYSTCTLKKDENEGVLNEFLHICNLKPIDISGIYGIIDVSDKDTCTNMITLLPHIHLTDGFFIAAFKKEDE
ncbi:MAG TPA: 16S rRNA (cytosine(967)-C(5))-methyltransferase RsmB [Firmicutes bacterium]|nr:16S rRNA (cytosine(967)-C(5))-methyltransferase RsmB [Bacillota bacterium]